MADVLTLSEIVPVATRFVQDGGAWAVFAVLALKLALDRHAFGNGAGAASASAQTAQAAQAAQATQTARDVAENTQRSLSELHEALREDAIETRTLIRETNEKRLDALTDLSTAVSNLAVNVGQQTKAIELLMRRG